MNKILIFTVIAIAIIGMIFLFGLGNKENTGGYLTSTVTTASSSVGMVTTEVITAGDNLQRFIMINIGSGQIDCAFGQDAVLEQGLHLNPVGSSTLFQLDITDPNLLGKAMDCIADATSTVQILEY